ncbi:MAG: replication-relaxation family protein [Armatimonadetes bacterium]|nr:replication-relaxation family protein [Armatimonadota bacterium]
MKLENGPKRELRLQSRDFEVVRTIFLHRIARRDDLLGLGFFGSVARCNQRLSDLVRAGWLRRVEGINGLAGHQSVYAPGKAAAAYLRRSLDLPADEISRHCSATEGPLLVEHALKVLDFRVQLHREADRTLNEWLCESECLHEFQVAAGQSPLWATVVMKPDAYFRLQVEQGQRHIFLEVDLGNVSLPRFEQKLDRYRTYAECGAFSEVFGEVHFSVLTVTVGERRLSHLADLPSRSFNHFVTTWQRIEEQGILGCICNTTSGSRVCFDTALRAAA